MNYNSSSRMVTIWMTLLGLQEWMIMNMMKMNSMLTTTTETSSLQEWTIFTKSKNKRSGTNLIQANSGHHERKQIQSNQIHYQQWIQTMKTKTTTRERRRQTTRGERTTTRNQVYSWQSSPVRIDPVCTGQSYKQCEKLIGQFEYDKELAKVIGMINESEWMIERSTAKWSTECKTWSLARWKKAIDKWGNKVRESSSKEMKQLLDRA